MSSDARADRVGSFVNFNKKASKWCRALKEGIGSNVRLEQTYPCTLCIVYGAYKLGWKPLFLSLPHQHPQQTFGSLKHEDIMVRLMKQTTYRVAFEETWTIHHQANRCIPIVACSTIDQSLWMTPQTCANGKGLSLGKAMEACLNKSIPPSSFCFGALRLPSRRHSNPKISKQQRISRSTWNCVFAQLCTQILVCLRTLQDIKTSTINMSTVKHTSNRTSDTYIAVERWISRPCRRTILFATEKNQISIFDRHGTHARAFLKGCKNYCNLLHHLTSSIVVFVAVTTPANSLLQEYCSYLTRAFHHDGHVDAYCFEARGALSTFQRINSLVVFVSYTPIDVKEELRSSYQQKTSHEKYTSIYNMPYTPNEGIAESFVLE